MKQLTKVIAALFIIALIGTSCRSTMVPKLWHGGCTGNNGGYVGYR